jgi:hypothetical protein
LDVPRGYDVSLAFELAPGEERSALRAQLYVNGYMFGRHHQPRTVAISGVVSMTVH